MARSARVAREAREAREARGAREARSSMSPAVDVKPILVAPALAAPAQT